MLISSTPIIALVSGAIMIKFLVKQPSLNLFRLLLIIEIIVVFIIKLLVEVIHYSVLHTQSEFTEIHGMIIIITIIGVCESAILLTIVIC